MTLQQAFNAILAGETVSLDFFDKPAFEVMRVSLLRKFRNYLNLLETLGAENPYAGKFLRCAWDRERCAGVFLLEDERRRVNIPAKLYTSSEL